MAAAELLEHPNSINEKFIGSNPTLSTTVKEKLSGEGKNDEIKL